MIGSMLELEETSERLWPSLGISEECGTLSSLCCLLSQNVTVGALLNGCTILARCEGIS